MTGETSQRVEAPFPVVQHPSGLLAQLSASAADDDNWEASPEYLQFLEAKYRDVECPLFLDELPHDVSSNPQLEALQALAFEGETPLSVVRRCREKGKEALEAAALAKRRGRRTEYAAKIREAEEAYSVVSQIPSPKDSPGRKPLQGAAERPVSAGRKPRISYSLLRRFNKESKTRRSCLCSTQTSRSATSRKAPSCSVLTVLDGQFDAMPET